MYLKNNIMKIAKIVSAALMVFAGVFAVSCSKETESKPANGRWTVEDTSKKPAEVIFTVAPGSVKTEYAEIVVSHDGAADLPWFGFATKDLTTDVSDLISAKVSSGIAEEDVHVGTTQTVAVPNLEEAVTYRYVAFALVPAGSAYTTAGGKAGTLNFVTSFEFNVTFSAVASDVTAHTANVTVTNPGHQDLTYRGFYTTDAEATVENLIAADFATIAPGGVLPEGFSLLTGNESVVKLENLTHDSSYRYVVYGVFVNEDGVAAVYGTPGECSFQTEIDPAEIQFSASLVAVKKDKVTVKVNHDCSDETITWFGFVTSDLTTSAATLAAAQAAGVEEADYKTGAQEVTAEGLDAETTYRYIVSGIDASGAFGKPADLKFTTLTEAYDNCVFTVEASDITAESATLTITHTGLDNFQYAGFFTTDLTSAAEAIALPDGVDSNLMEGKEFSFEVKDLDPSKEYRYIVVGRLNGDEYGTRGDVKFTTAGPVWALDANWTVTAEEFSATVTVAQAGVSGYYRIVTAETAMLLENAESIEKGIETVVAPWNNSNLPSAGQSVIDGVRHSDTFTESDLSLDYDTDYVIIALGISYGGYATGHYAYVEHKIEDPTVSAPYEEFLGGWMLSGNLITISENVPGESYIVEGIPGTDKFYSEEVKPVVARYENGRFFLPEQIVGQWNNTNYGTCYDVVCGLFEATSTSGTVMHFVNYPRYADEPSDIFSLCKYPDGTYVVRPGMSENGKLDQLGVRWVIAEGQYKGQGNPYVDDLVLPDTMEKAQEESSAFKAWLGTWYVPTVVYQYDDEDNYIGDETQSLPIVIKSKVPNESYSISGIGPANDSYDVAAEFASNGSLIVHPQTVRTWTHSEAGEINERLVGIYGEGDNAMVTWNPSYTLFTATISGNNASLVPGDADGETFNGFAFRQMYSDGAYGYGGRYDLPNTMSRTQSTSAVTVKAVKSASAKGALVPARESRLSAENAVMAPRSVSVQSLVK